MSDNDAVSDNEFEALVQGARIECKYCGYPEDMHGAVPEIGMHPFTADEGGDQA